MKGEKLSRYIGDIDNKYIEEAENYSKEDRKNHKKIINRKTFEYLCVAACFCLLIAGASVLGLVIPKDGTKQSDKVQEITESESSTNDACDESAVDNSVEDFKIADGAPTEENADTGATDDKLSMDENNYEESTDEAPSLAARTPSICIIGNKNSGNDGNVFDEAFENDKKYVYRPYETAADTAAQIELAYSCIKESYNFIIIDPASEDGWEEFLEDVSDDNIQVIFINREVSCKDTLYKCFIGYEKNSDTKESITDVLKKVIDKLCNFEDVEKQYMVKKK